MSTSQESGQSPSERRHHQRLPPIPIPTYVWLSLETKLRAEVIDESTGGIGIRILEACDRHALHEGFEIRVQYKETRRTALIVYIQAESGAATRLGLKWCDDAA